MELLGFGPTGRGIKVNWGKPIFLKLANKLKEGWVPHKVLGSGWVPQARNLRPTNSKIKELGIWARDNWGRIFPQRGGKKFYPFLGEFKGDTRPLWGLATLPQLG